MRSPHTQAAAEPANRPQPSLLELEMYKQAHEARRKWEGYIWQWGVVVTALVSFSAVLLAAPSRVGSLSRLSTDAGPEIAFLSKAMLLLLAVFLFSIALNVFRARQLTKRIDQTIALFHRRFQVSAFPVVPCELDGPPTRWSCFLSSTRYSVIAHFLAFATFLAVAIYEVFWR